MEQDNENRSKWMKVRLKPKEEKELYKCFEKSTFQNLSEFARAMILGKPVTVIYRDKSMDDLLEELALLRRELRSIGNNLNQAVKQINSTQGFPDAALWMQLLTIIKGKVEPNIAEVREKMNQYSDLWSQKLRAEKA